MQIISIVTPSYNQGAFIEETIRSVLSQRGFFFIDYIIMDGGSKDESVNIIKKIDSLLRLNHNFVIKNDIEFYIKNKDSKKNLVNCSGVSYRWVSRKDKGQVDAIKKGFKMAVGDILCWLNSDDIYIDNDVLNKVHNHFLKDNKLELLTGDGPFINKEGKEIGIHHVERINYKELLFLDYHILQPSTFFKRNIYKEDYLNEKYTCAFDADFFIHLLYDKVKYKKVDESFGAFRFYPDNKTIGLNKVRFKEQILISIKYSKNFVYFFISVIYRYLEIVLGWKNLPNRNKKKKIFNFIYKTAYKLITGKPNR